jgi:polysaccharide deacetylase family protein (PEP-CTERM system associated)
VSYDAERPHNILTVDVEEWFHILEVDGGHPREEWPSLESRVAANTETLLELFEAFDARATFFVVGWVAARNPDLVRRIASAGHELASHSYWHEVIRRHDRASLAADLGGSRKLLEDLAGRPVRGFRAPGGSITPETAWAFDVIVEQGYAYDSSLCPGYSSHGGFPSPFFGPHLLRCQAGELAELPSSTVGVGRRRLPYAGGGYLRLFPYPAIRTCIRLDNRAGRPSNVYVHPREIDPGQPRMALPWKRRFKYYVGLRSARAKLEALLREHRFLPAGEWLAAHAQELAGRTLDVRAQAAGSPVRPPPATPPPPPVEQALRDAAAR